jgi:hypothetical protein
MVAGAPFSNVSDAFCCIVLQFACPATLYTGNLQQLTVCPIGWGGGLLVMLSVL